MKKKEKVKLKTKTKEGVFKKIKKLVKRVVNRIKYAINPDSVSKKVRKQIKAEKEMASHYSWWTNVVRFFTGCNVYGLKIN